MLFTPSPSKNESCFTTQFDLKFSNCTRIYFSSQISYGHEMLAIAHWHNDMKYNVKVLLTKYTVLPYLCLSSKYQQQ